MLQLTTKLNWRSAFPPNGVAVGLHAEKTDEADDLVDETGQADSELTKRVNEYFQKNFLEQLLGSVIGDSFPLGHGAVLSHPDKPFLKWGYKNGLGQEIERNNPRDFLEAAEK